MFYKDMSHRFAVLYICNSFKMKMVDNLNRGKPSTPIKNQTVNAIKTIVMTYLNKQFRTKPNTYM